MYIGTKVFHEHLSPVIVQLYQDKLKEILDSYSESDRVKLKNILPEFELSLMSPRSTRKIHRCKAITYMGNNCRRPQMKNTGYCKIHQEKTDLDKKNINNYVQTELIDLNGHRYLKDSIGLLYDPDKHLIVGRFVDNVIYHYS